MKEGETSCDCDQGYYRSETDPAAMPCTRELNANIRTSLRWVNTFLETAMMVICMDLGVPCKWVFVSLNILLLNVL